MEFKFWGVKMALYQSRTDSYQGKGQPAVFQKLTAFPNRLSFSRVISVGSVLAHVPPG